MKKLLILLSLTLGFAWATLAQTVNGFIKVNGQSKTEIKLKSNNLVNLYAAFRENQYPILFNFKSSDIPLNADKKEVVMIQFSTTVKKDGKVLGTVKRNPIPFFPGDMFMPVETFDFISIMANLQQNQLGKVSEIPKGTYEVVLEAKADGVKGNISAANLIIFF